MRISDWSSDVCSSDLFSAPGFAEVDIEIGHRHAFRIKEALEKQTQSERVEIGDGERPGNYRARARPAARAHRNIIVLCPFDEDGNDEELTGKTHKLGTESCRERACKSV